MSVILIGFKQIQQKVIDLLKTDTDLAGVRTWCYGRPEGLQDLRYPVVWVDEATNEDTPIRPATVKKFTHTLRYYVTVLDRHPRVDGAEMSVQDMGEHIMAKLDDDPTLGGLVNDSYFIAKRREKIVDEDHSISGFRVTLECVKTV